MRKCGCRGKLGRLERAPASSAIAQSTPDPCAPKSSNGSSSNQVMLEGEEGREGEMSSAPTNTTTASKKQFNASVIANSFVQKYYKVDSLYLWYPCHHSTADIYISVSFITLPITCEQVLNNDILWSLLPQPIILCC